MPSYISHNSLTGTELHNPKGLTWDNDNLSMVANKILQTDFIEPVTGGGSIAITKATINLLGGTLDVANNSLLNVNIDSGDISGVTISSGLTWSSAQNLNSQALTNVNIDSGDISGITLSASTISASGLITANAGIKDSSLTTGRILFADSDQTITDDSDLTFSGDTLTATKIGAFQAAGNIDFNNVEMTNVRIISGTVSTGETLSVSDISSSGNITASSLTSTGNTTVSGNLKVSSIQNSDGESAISIDSNQKVTITSELEVPTLSLGSNTINFLNSAAIKNSSSGTIDIENVLRVYDGGLSLTLNTNSITSSTSAISFADNNLTTTGNITSNNLAASSITYAGELLTPTAVQINKLSDITASAVEINKLDGLIATTAEINKLSGSAAGTVTEGTVAVYGAGGALSGTLQTTVQANIEQIGNGTLLTVLGDLKVNGNSFNMEDVEILHRSGLSVELRNISTVDATTKSTFEDGITALSGLTNIQGQAFTLTGPLTVESTSIINQDLTTDAFGVQFGNLQVDKLLFSHTDNEITTTTGDLNLSVSNLASNTINIKPKAIFQKVLQADENIELAGGKKFSFSGAPATELLTEGSFPEGQNSWVTSPVHTEGNYESGITFSDGLVVFSYALHPQTNETFGTGVTLAAGFTHQFVADSTYTVVNSDVVTVTGDIAGDAANDEYSYNRSNGILTVNSAAFSDDENVTVVWNAPKTTADTGNLVNTTITTITHGKTYRVYFEILGYTQGTISIYLYGNANEYGYVNVDDYTIGQQSVDIEITNSSGGALANRLEVKSTSDPVIMSMTGFRVHEDTGTYITGSNTDITLEADNELYLNADTKIDINTLDVNISRDINVARDIDVEGDIDMAENKKLTWVDDNTSIYGTGTTLDIDTDGTLTLDATTEVLVETATLDIDITTLEMDGATASITFPTTTITANTKLNLDSTAEVEIDSAVIDLDGSSNIYLTSPLTTISGDVFMATDEKLYWTNTSTYISGNDTSLTVGCDAKVVIDADSGDADAILLDGNVKVTGNLLIVGTETTENETSLDVTNKTISVNVSGAAGSGSAAGLQVEEDGSDTGYILTNSTRKGWDIKAPAAAAVITLESEASLTTLSTTASNGIQINNPFKVTGATDIDSTLNVDAGVTFNSTFDVDGATTLNSTLDVDGGTTLNSTLDVDGATTLNDALDVDGHSELNSTLNVDGIATFQNDVIINADNKNFKIQLDDTTDKFTVASATGNTVIKGTSEVTGVGTFLNNIILNSSAANKLELQAGGTPKFTVLNASGDTTTQGTLTAVGATALQSTLVVTGTTTLNNTLTQAGGGATSLSGTLGVTGNTTLTGTLTANSTSTFNDNTTITTDKKLYLRDDSQYIYSSVDNKMDLIAPNINIVGSSTIRLTSDQIEFELGTGGANDLVLKFLGEDESESGYIKWMQDEFYFEYYDDIRMKDDEKIMFNDSGTYIYSSTNGTLDVVSDTTIKNTATTLQFVGTTLDVDAATIDVATQATNVDLKNSTVGALTFETNLLTLDTNNSRVGIGTATPSERLDILNGSIQTSQGDSTYHLKMVRTGYDTYGFKHSSGTGLELRNITDGDALEFKFENGKLGIGITSPTEALHVDGNAIITGDLTVSGNDITFGNGEYISNAIDGYISTNAHIQFAGDVDSIINREDRASIGAGYDLIIEAQKGKGVPEPGVPGHDGGDLILKGGVGASILGGTDGPSG